VIDITVYLLNAIKSFTKDPPDSDYQRGYLAGLLVLWDETHGGSKEMANETIREARTLI
jgi:hypothetical protein